MKGKIRVAAVSYLNTLPFLHGLKTSPIWNEIELQLLHPADISLKLRNGEVDLGLVPVVSLTQIPGAKQETDFCIGCNGAVGSVCIYSEVSLEEIKQVYLDYQSRTSTELVKILFKNFWKFSPALIDGSAGYEKDIKGTTAGLIIGDRALRIKEQFPYCFDLGNHWKQFTGLPFMFACWATVDFNDNEFLTQFNEALQSGINQLNEVIRKAMQEFPGTDVSDYLRTKIRYSLNEEMKAGLVRFLELANQL